MSEKAGRKKGAAGDRAAERVGAAETLGAVETLGTAETAMVLDKPKAAKKGADKAGVHTVEGTAEIVLASAKKIIARAGTVISEETARGRGRADGADGREADQKRVTAALLRMLAEETVDPETGVRMTWAEWIAASIIRNATGGSVRPGNVRMMELLLGLTGEAPEKRIAASIEHKAAQAMELSGLSDAELEELAERDE